MSTTTPDVAQLSPCCGEPLEWAQEDDYHEAHCSCGAVVIGDGPERDLMPTEDLLLARIAELEAAQRWRVTAEELPPVGEWVIGWWPVGSIPCDVVSFDGAFWNAAGAHGIRPPDQWQPIVRVASSQGADVPKEQQ